MSKLLFKLRNVPDDEADEIRSLLDANKIAYFETDAGNWGVSMPGIWLQDEADFSHAKDLLNDYQKSRAERAREQFNQQKKAGNQPNLIDSLREKPLISLGLILFCLFILYFSLKPFITLVEATRP